VPGKYVYTVTDTTCGTTYTDSITLTHPHQYDISNVSVQQTCTNASVTATISNNSFFAASTPYTTNLGNPNDYTVKLIDSSGNIIQSQNITVPTYVLFAATDGSVKTETVTFTNVSIGTYSIKLFHDSAYYFYNPYTSCGPVIDTAISVKVSALDISSSVFLNCGGTSGSISVNASGGVKPYTYELYNGTVSPANLVTTQSSPLFTGLNASQTYSVRVIDNCGTGTTVSKSFAPYAVIMRQLGTACIGNNLTLYTDSLAGATYSWTKNGVSLNDTTRSYNIASLTSADYGTYVVTVTIAGCNSFSATRTIDASSCSVLSVQLITFTANASAGKSYLEWQTAQEENNAGFAIERSSDGINWHQINFIASKAVNNSQQNLSYSCYDNNPLSGLNYYRLKQIDIDGNINYSIVQHVEFAVNSDKIAVFPNPVDDRLYIITNDRNNIKQIKLADAAGKVVYINSTEKDGINMRNYIPGVYILQITKANGEMQTKKIIKQ